MLFNDELAKLAEEFGEREVEMAQEYLDTEPTIDMLGFIIGANRIIAEHNKIEKALGIFESTHGFTLAERVKLLRQAYDRLWDKLHPVKVSDEDEDK